MSDLNSVWRLNLELGAFSRGGGPVPGPSVLAAPFLAVPGRGRALPTAWAGGSLAFPGMVCRDARDLRAGQIQATPEPRPIQCHLHHEIRPRPPHPPRRCVAPSERRPSLGLCLAPAHWDHDGGRVGIETGEPYFPGVSGSPSSLAWRLPRPRGALGAGGSDQSTGPPPTS